MGRGLGQAALLMAAVAACVPDVADAQSVGHVFRKVNPAVVVIRAKGQDVEGSGGLTRFTETGSGVLISADGKVMTAAHVVHAMDEIAVEFLGGETVPACVLSSEPAADLSLLKLERVPKGISPAPIGDSDAVRVGDQVLIIGAPYGGGAGGHVEFLCSPIGASSINLVELWLAPLTQNQLRRGCAQQHTASRSPFLSVYLMSLTHETRSLSPDTYRLWPCIIVWVHELRLVRSE